MSAGCRHITVPAPAIDRYLLQAPALSSKPAACRCCCRSTGQTDGQADWRTDVLWRLLLYCIQWRQLTRVQGWGHEPCEPTVRLPDWSELVASYSRMKSAWDWANGEQPILVCYIRKYVIILGDIPVDVPQPKYWGWCVPGIPGGIDASDCILCGPRTIGCCGWPDSRHNPHSLAKS